MRRLARLAGETGADELMLWTPIHDLRARVRSHELVKKHFAAAKVQDPAILNENLQA